jgi:hypothetical protein
MRTGRRRDAEAVGDREACDLVDEAHGQPNRHQKPVIAEGEGKFGDAHAQEVGDARFCTREVDVAVLALPVAFGRHAGVANRRRMT